MFASIDDGLSIFQGKNFCGPERVGNHMGVNESIEEKNKARKGKFKSLQLREKFIDCLIVSRRGGRIKWKSKKLKLFENLLALH